MSENQSTEESSRGIHIPISSAKDITVEEYEKKLKPDVFAIDFNYLRPDTSILKKREESDFDEDGKRKYYYGTEFTDEETQEILEFETQILEENLLEKLPRSWSKFDSLRMVSTNKSDLPKAIAQLKTQLIWFESLKKITLSEGAIELLKDGNVFLGPRDKLGNPSLWVVFGDIKMSNETADNFSSAMMFCALIMKKYMMVPGYIDKFTAVFDLSQRNVMMAKPPLIIKIMTCFKDTFNGFSAKSIVVNTTFSFNIIWSGISSVISKNTLKKFEKYDKKEQHGLLNSFHKED